MYNNISVESLQKIPFRMYKYTDVVGNFFKKKSCYSHYHLNFSYKNVYNIDVGFQLTSHPDIHIKNEFTQFDNVTPLNIKYKQYISKSLRLYDLNFVKPYTYDFEKQIIFNDYIKNHNYKCNDYVKIFFLKKN